MKLARKLINIKEILPKVIEQISSGGTAPQINVEIIWKEIIDLEITGSFYDGYKDGCIFVKVDSSARLYQWQLKKANILRKISKRYPEVKNILIKIGKIK